MIIKVSTDVTGEDAYMLNVFYGDMPNVIYNTAVYFKNTYAEEWITAPLTREMIQDVDHSTVLDSGVIDSPVLGKIPPVQLSGGVKTLILIANEPEKVFNASTCGDNCAKWLLKIAENRDVTINLRHLMDFGNGTSKHFGDLKQTYNEFFRIYGNPMGLEKLKPVAIITEDSNSGFQFFQAVCAENGIFCESAGGKSNIFKMLSDRAGENILVVADGAAFGSQMERIMQLLALQPDSHIYLPESFEWLILRSGLLEDTEVDEILKSPEDHVESQQYFSWERYFTAVLMQKTADSYLKYTKSKLNPVYLQEHEKKAILSEMSHIQLDKKDI